MQRSGKLIATLRASKLYDDALIVVAADHGRAWARMAKQTHGVFLYDETIRVPLLLKSTRKTKTRESE